MTASDTSLRDALVRVADQYAAAKGLSRSRVSTIVFSGGSVIERLANGGDITTGNFERGMMYFSDNWPPGVDWPAGIARPAPSAPASSGEAA